MHQIHPKREFTHTKNIKRNYFSGLAVNRYIRFSFHENHTIFLVYFIYENNNKLYFTHEKSLDDLYSNALNQTMKFL